MATKNGRGLTGWAPMATVPKGAIDEVNVEVGKIFELHPSDFQRVLDVDQERQRSGQCLMELLLNIEQVVTVCYGPEHGPGIYVAIDVDRSRFARGSEDLVVGEVRRIIRSFIRELL